MSELMRNPKVMKKAQEEVRRMMENKSPQDHENHMDELPYLRMVIKETMRLHPVVPLLLPRLCRESCHVGGFEIAKGTRVIINAWALATSPENWNEPEAFRPERLEDSVVVNDKGTQFKLMPFGGGRRMCPGDGFALATLELMVARLLYYFEWSLPDGMRPDELDMDVKVGTTSRRRNELRVVASPCSIPIEI
jgi:cytochrome P450